ncbi:response regulator transcription factor [Sphingobacterium mizutaii]|uniref:response regulator transcription factor n=1 Tax=Sphingobacterium mizutaii TaxID=1010 RepID=UPI0012FD19EA
MFNFRHTFKYCEWSSPLIEAAFTRADALTLLETNKVDVVLANINMPRINGIDDTLSIKKNQPKTRVNAISNISEGIF